MPRSTEDSKILVNKYLYYLIFLRFSKSSLSIFRSTGKRLDKDVTCSRAEEYLALVLWSLAPTLAMEQIKKNGWFAEEEIQEIRLD